MRHSFVTGQGSKIRALPMKGDGMAGPFTFRYQSGRDELSVTFTVERGGMVMTGDSIWPVVLDAKQVLIVSDFITLIVQGELSSVTSEGAE